MSTKMTSRIAIVALTAVAPFALAASALAADPMGSATTAKPAISDSMTAGAKVNHDKDTTKDATKPGTSAKSGSAGISGDRNAGVAGAAKSGDATTGTGLTPSMSNSAKTNAPTKPGTVTHDGTDVAPKATTNPAGKL
jgi:hypothetical protein